MLKTCFSFYWQSRFRFFTGKANCSDPSEALFHGGETECRALFNDSFRPLFSTDDIFGGNSALKSAAMKTCGNNTACLFDVARTKDTDFGKATKESQENTEKTSAEESEFNTKSALCFSKKLSEKTKLWSAWREFWIETLRFILTPLTWLKDIIGLQNQNCSFPANSAPQFANNDTEIRVEVGKDGSVDVTATDPDKGDSVNVTLDTSALWLRLNGTVLLWKNASDSSTQVNATLEATDSKGLTTSMAVKIQMCDCKVSSFQRFKLDYSVT